MRRFLFSLLCVCLLSTGAFAQTSGSPGGLVVFETFGSGQAADSTQAVVLAGVMTTHIVLFATANPRLARNIGLAIVNPGSTTATVTLTLRRGTDGVTISSKAILIGARQQTSRFMAEIFADVPQLATGFDGDLSISSDYPVALTALRFRGTNFSTIPITSLSSSTPVPTFSPGVGGPTAVILPQFAAGGTWSSEIVISNTSSVQVPVRLDIFRQNGQPLTTKFNGETGSSFKNLVIPPQGIVIKTNDDTGALQVGYAIVTPLDSIAPTVISTVPANGDYDVPLSRTVMATFSEAMDPSTINASTFTLKNGGLTISGAVSYAGTTATFVPVVPFASNTTYTATITTGAKDETGNALAANYVWNFSTIGPVTTPVPGPGGPPPAHLGPQAVDLTCAANFAILAGTTITNVNNPGTTVDGNIALFPYGSVTGFPPGVVVNGSILKDAGSDPQGLASPAKGCLTTAYLDAAGRALNVIIVADGELGGKTLAPGLYKSGIGSFAITNSDLTLDGQGDPTAVWIFQMPSSTLTVNNGRIVTLAGLAVPKNIFWQVGSSATLGTTSNVKGNILALDSITLQTGAVLNGRALARNAAVSLDTNAVTKPAP